MRADRVWKILVVLILCCDLPVSEERINERSLCQLDYGNVGYADSSGGGF